MHNIASSGRCRNMSKPPEVRVADSEHLFVNWTKSFEGCDSSEVLNTNLYIGSDVVEVTFCEGEAKIKANPCLRQPPISVRLQLEEKILWSQSSHYNDFNVDPKIEDLYAGLLQKQLLDKTCLKEDGELYLPDRIPDEIEKCVDLHLKTRRTSIQLSFTIVDPQNKNKRKLVRSESKTFERCTTSKKEIKKSIQPLMKP